MVAWNENQITVNDVTDDPNSLQTARMLVAENYARLSSQTLRAEEVYDELCHDDYQQRGFARTFLAEGYNPSTGKFSKALGTLRLVLGHDHTDLAPLEIMSLMRPTGGWNMFRFAEFQPEVATEFCRFVVAQECRDAICQRVGMTHLINRALVNSAMDHGHRQGYSQFWAIMPRYVVRVVERAGFELNQAPHLPLNCELHDALFAKYDRYWLRNTPALFRLRKNSSVLAA